MVDIIKKDPEALIISISLLIPFHKYLSKLNFEITNTKFSILS
jgi:hypothetical protein